MKRILVILIIAALFLPVFISGCSPSNNITDPIASVKTYKDIPDVTSGEISAVEDLKSYKDSFTYGVMLSSEAFVLQDGSSDGFTAKFCELLSDLFGIDFILEFYGWDELIHKLDNMSLDFTGELTPTEERRQIYGMTPPIAERKLRIFTLVNSDKIIETEQDVNNLRIGFLEDTVTADSIRLIYPLSFTVINVADYEMAATMLGSGWIDAFVEEATADPAFEEYDFIKSKIFFPMVHAPVSMTTANPELEPVISIINKYIRAGGINKLYELYHQGDFNYDRYKLYNSFTDEEKDYIKDLTQNNSSVAVAYEHDNYPVDFYNDKEKEFEGIAVDVLTEISKLTDIDFVPAVTKDATWAEIYDKLVAGEISMVAQLLQSDERIKEKKFIWNAVPYAQTYYAFISRADYPYLDLYQITHSNVGALKSSGKVSLYRKLFPENNNLIEYDTQNECLDALERGEIDLFIASEYNLITQTNFREKSGLKINIKLNEPLNSHFGFNKNERVLCSIIDKAQKYINTGMIETSWTGKVFDYSKKMAEDRAFFFTLFAGLASLLLIGAGFALMHIQHLNKQLKVIASNDALTGIYNRRFFMELSAGQIERSFRTGIDCFVIIFDLDHFKLVNDTYGHQAGDAVLRESAQRAKKTIRPYDIIGRYGGEEFIILMSDVKDIGKSNVMNAAERIRLAICETPVEFEDIKIAISASFGVARVAQDHNIELATKYADEALYEAKETGRNKIIFHVETTD